MNVNRIGTFNLTLFLAAIIMAFTGIMASGQESAQTPIPDAKACLECHEDAGENLKGSLHQIAEDKGGGIKVSCIGCHSGWEAHLEEPSKENILVPSELSFLNQAELCAGCHQNDHQTAMVSTDPHGQAQINCTTCHTVHGNKVKGLVKEDRPNFCTTCHTDIAAQFKSRSAHPLESSNIRCIDCHTFADRKNHLLARGVDWQCQQCHSDIGGPYVYEHPVVYDHLVQGGGCVECHNPHGSVNDRLLKQPGEGLCLQCHGIPPLHRTAHSGMAMKVSCVNCHSDIHGSNENDRLLDPMLTTKFFADCYQSGCHAR